MPALTSRSSNHGSSNPVVRLLLAALVAVALVVSLGSGAPARAATMPWDSLRKPATSTASPASTTITANSSLGAVKAAVAAATANGGTITLVNPTNLSVNTKQLCDLVVVAGLFTLSGAVVAYLATAGIGITIAGVVLSAGQVASIATGLINWTTVYTYVDTNVCK